MALHIAAAKPVCVTREEVPPALLEKEKEIARAQIKGKPPQILEKIVEGKMDKYFSTICLMEQAFIKDPDKTVKDLLTATIAELGENIVIKRFTVYELGQSEAPSE